MAFKGIKRAASKAAGAARKRSGGVGAHCNTIASAIRDAQDVPQPVRSMLCDTLHRTFGTFKEERHEVQNSLSASVGKVLNGIENKLERAVDEAQQNKARVEAEAAPALAAKNAALGASESAANALVASKTALVNSRTELVDAKAALHVFEGNVKSVAAVIADATTKKKDLEELMTDYVGAVKAGKKHGAAIGRHLAKELESKVDAELLGCVAQTFSKPASAWGTFDNVIEKRFEECLNSMMADVVSELEGLGYSKASIASSVEGAKGAIVAAQEKVKTTAELCTNATAALKEAEAAAKTGVAAAKQHEQQIQKAADACTRAAEDLAEFKEGPLAAYNEVEARSRPSEPEPAQPEAPADAVEAAMAPAPAARPTPSILPSPGVLSWVGQQMSGLAGTPRVAQSPGR